MLNVPFVEITSTGFIADVPKSVVGNSRVIVFQLDHLLMTRSEE